MTYLEAINKVLRLLREPTIASTTTSDDVVADMVAELVNDAKHTVEDAHVWNATRTKWAVTAAADADSVVLPGSSARSSVEYVLADDGRELRRCSSKELAKLKAGSPASGEVGYFSVDGAASGELKVAIHPAPSSSTTLTFHGYSPAADLSSDDDVIAVPYQPVVYFALAMAARERGEVGGQTAAEIFSLAGNYLSDAIAKDVALSQKEFDWIVG